MNNNIFEEFYGPNMESEMIGNEGLGKILAGTAGAIGVIIAGKWLFDKWKKKKEEKIKQREEQSRYEDIKVAAISIGSEDEMGTHYDNLLGIIKKINTQFKGKDSNYTYSTLQFFTDLVGAKFNIKLQAPYPSKEAAIGKFRDFVAGRLSNKEVFRDLLIEHIPSSENPLSIYDVGNKVFVSGTGYVFRKDDKNGKICLDLYSKQSGKSVTFVEGQDLRKYGNFGQIIQTAINRCAIANGIPAEVEDWFTNMMYESFYDDIIAVENDITPEIYKKLGYTLDRSLWNPTFANKTDEERKIPNIMVVIKHN